MDEKMRKLLSSNRSHFLYIMEFMIIGLNFESENMIDEVNDDNSYLSIDLTFPNLPTFTINEGNINSSKKRKNKLNSDDFSTPGISCLFSKRPNDFSNTMEGKKPLKVDIYKLNIDSICQKTDDIDKRPICQTEIRFHRCLCDQFDMKLINNDNLPEPFEIRDAYELFDTINEPCGTLEIFTRISCCGSLIITQFYHNEKKFVFNDINSTNKFTCSRILSAKEKKSGAIVNAPKAETIVGVSKLCGDLQIRIDKPPSTSITEITRVRGGGSHDRHIIPSIFPLPSIDTLLSGACKANHEDKRPGFHCCGELGLGLMKMEHGWSNNPCHGIDHLTRAFKDTQKFVDNIRVSGMSGLGLMNPIESPYFGRIPLNDSPISLSTRKPTEYISDNLKYIDMSFDHSNRVNRPQNNLELIKHREKKPDKSPCDEELCQSKKVLHENTAIYNEKPSTNPTQLVSQSHAISELGTTHTTRKREKRLVKKHRSWSQRIYSSKNGIKPNRQVIRLVQSVANPLHFGHKSCVDIRIRVPGNMGWLWNTKNTAGEPKAQMGWKPGAISRRVWRLLENAKVEKTDVVRVEHPTTLTIRGKKSKILRKRNPFLLPRSFATCHEHDNEYELPPILHVHRKSGTYYITVYPVKKEFLHQPELQENVPPLQFKVTKKTADNDGYDSNVSSSITSDMEFEFSPPVAETRYTTKVTSRNVGTQVQQQEIDDSVNDSTSLFMKFNRKNTKTRRF